MAYVDVPDPLLDTGKPGRSADWKQIRDNIRYLKDQADALAISAAGSNNSITDDFTGAAAGIGPWWASNVGAGDTVGIVSEHQLRCLTNGNTTGDYAGVIAADYIHRVVKTEEYVAVMECRVKRPGTDVANYFFGWQDVSLTAGSGNVLFDYTNIVGVIKGTGAQTWNANTVNGGAVNSSGDFGTATNWHVIKLVYTCSATAGSRKVEVYNNGSLIATLNDNTKIPTVALRPVMGCVGNGAGAASREVRFDYAIFTVQARPLAA